VIWNCGAHPAAGTPATTPGTTTVLPKYLPQTCR